MTPKCGHCPIPGEHCPAFHPTCLAIEGAADKRSLFVDLVDRYGAGPCAEADPEEAERLIELTRAAMAAHPRGGGCCG